MCILFSFYCATNSVAFPCDFVKNAKCELHLSYDLLHWGFISARWLLLLYLRYYLAPRALCGNIVQHQFRHFVHLVSAFEHLRNMIWQPAARASLTWAHTQPQWLRRSIRAITYAFGGSGQRAVLISTNWQRICVIVIVMVIVIVAHWRPVIGIRLIDLTWSVCLEVLCALRSARAFVRHTLWRTTADYQGCGAVDLKIESSFFFFAIFSIVCSCFYSYTKLKVHHYWRYKITYFIHLISQKV